MSSFAINDFELPITIKNDCEYIKKLSSLLQKYAKAISSQSEIIPTECINTMNLNINAIQAALQHYFNAEIPQAQQCISEVLQRYLSHAFIVNEIDKNYAFRGMAPDYIPKSSGREVSLSEHYKNMNEFPLSFFKARCANHSITRNDMLHIPFSMREKIATRRFSVPGVPCIYLGTTSLVCWLELNKPEDAIFCCSAYKLPGNLKVLNLCIQQHFINGSSIAIKTVSDEKKYEMQKTFFSSIELFPLVIATSFRVSDHEERKFKSEYVISQLVMQVIKENGIDGVAYFSKKMKDSYCLFQGVNLALLANCTNINADSDYCEIKDKIIWTDPIKLSDFSPSQRGDANSAGYKSFCNHFFYDKTKTSSFVQYEDNKEDLYTDTIHSQFDEFLLNLFNSEPKQ